MARDDDEFDELQRRVKKLNPNYRKVTSKAQFEHNAPLSEIKDVQDTVQNLVKQQLASTPGAMSTPSTQQLYSKLQAANQAHQRVVDDNLKYINMVMFSMRIHSAHTRRVTGYLILVWLAAIAIVVL